MGVVKIEEHRHKLPFPGVTPLLKEVGGRVAHIGSLPPYNADGNGTEVYVTERESREIVAAWGWPNQEKYLAVLEQNAALSADVERLTAELVEAKSQQTRVVSVADLEGIGDLVRHATDGAKVTVAK